MDVKILDEGQTGIKEVAGSVPMEEKIYAVCIPTDMRSQRYIHF